MGVKLEKIQTHITLAFRNNMKGLLKMKESQKESVIQKGIDGFNNLSKGQLLQVNHFLHKRKQKIKREKSLAIPFLKAGKLKEFHQ